MNGGMIMTRNLPILTNSELTCYRECPRKHHYKYVECLRATSASPALDLGTRWHKLLEWLYRGDGIVRIDDDLQAMYAGYKRVPGEVLGVELELKAEIGGITFAGKLDAVVKDGEDTYIVEHKTTSSDIGPGAPYWDMMRNSSQLTLYQMLYPAASGVVLDAVQKGRKPKFAQQLIVHTRDELERARETLLDWADLVTHNRSKAKNTDACHKYGVVCEFMPLCSGGQALYRHGRRHEELSDAG